MCTQIVLPTNVEGAIDTIEPVTNATHIPTNTRIKVSITESEVPIVATATSVPTIPVGS